MRGGQHAPRLLEQEVELHHSFKNKLGTDELALGTHRLDPDRKQDRGLSSPLEPHLVREGKGLFLDGAQLIVFPLVLALAQSLRLVSDHAAANRPFYRLACGNIHSQIHPQQNLPRVEGPGLGAAEPGACQHRPTLCESGRLRLAGKGQACLHPPQAASALRLVQNRGPHHAGNLDRPLPSLLTAEHRLPADVHNAQNIRAGVGHDALQRFLLAQGYLRHCITADDGITFKFHGVLSLVIVSAWLC